MRTLVNTLATLVRRAAPLVIVLAIVISAILGAFQSQAELAQGNEGFAPDAPEIVAAERIGELFGEEANEEVVQVVVTGDDVISASGLQAYLRVRQAIEARIGDRLSANEQRPGIVGFLDPVLQAAAFQGIPLESLTDEQVDQLFAAALAQMPEEQRGFVTGLLSERSDLAAGESPAGLILTFMRLPEGEDADAVFNELIEIEIGLAEDLAAIEIPGIDIKPFSFALLFADQDDFQQEVGGLFALAALIIVLILLFVFWIKPVRPLGLVGAARRAVADMLLAMAAILMSITWMQGLGVLLGPDYLGLIGPFTPPTQIIPVLLIGLGVDYAIHLTTRYREEVGEGETVVEAITGAIRSVGVALVLATVTTVIGFLTNIFNPVPALKDFGILAAIGIGAAFLLMLTFVPSVRLLLDRRAEAAGRLPREAMAATSERILPELMARTSVLAERFAIPTLVVTLFAAGLGIYGLTQLETRFSVTDFVSEDNAALQALRIIEEEFGGGFGETTDVLVEAAEGSDLATPDAHNAMVAAQRNLVDTPNVVLFGEFPSAESPISLLGSLLAPDPATGAPASLDVAAAAQAAGLGPDLRVSPDADVKALYDALFAAAPERAARVLHRDGGRYDAARWSIQTQAGEEGAAQLREDLLADFEPVAALGHSVVPTSQQIITAVIARSLSESQTSSLLLTILAAGLVLIINFAIEARKPFLGVITIAPVVLVVLWTYGMMAATDIPFGPVTATIAALGIGIGVPFTIHVARRFLEDQARFDNLEDAIRSTMRHTGGALAGSAFTTMAGFGVLITSSLKPFQQFGLVTVYSIGFALIAAVLVLPSMLALWDRFHRENGNLPSKG